jgi:hypothetical protein
MDLFHPTSLTFYSVSILVLFAGAFIIGRGYKNREGGFKRIVLFLLFCLLWMFIPAYFSKSIHIESLKDFQGVVVSGFGIPLLIMSILLIGSRKTLDNLSEKWLTFFQVLRIPLELAVYGMFIKGLLPEKMTFVGLNPDLVFGLFAPVLAMYYYSNHSIGKFYPFLFHLLGGLSLIWICYLGLFPSGLEEEDTFILGNATWFSYPWVWHWTFLLPMFFLAHVISFYRLLHKVPESGPE